MDLRIRPLSAAERMYTYYQSQQICIQTGLIGFLRADMDTDGFGFFSNWFGYTNELNTQEFKQEFDNVINSLRNGSNNELLKNRGALNKYCLLHPECSFGNGREYGVRVDTDKYAYLLRLNPNKGEYNLYSYNFVKERLDNHLKNAECGIRFITPNYEDLFMLPDGGKIEVRFPDGKTKIETCRYVDDYHLILYPDSLYHICQLSEKMQELGCTVTPYKE